MSRTSLILGAVVSLIIHGVILFPGVVNRSDLVTTPPVAEHERGTITVAALPPAPEVRPPQRKPEQPAPPPAPPLKEIVRPVVEVPGEMGLGDLAENVSDDALPTLTILWTGPDGLRAVCRSLGLRVVAVNSRNEVVGEVALDGEIRLTRFSGNFGQYSNRVRTLAPSFFGTALSQRNGVSFAALWILVPPDVDRRFCNLQREAIRRQGVPASRVASVEARFEPAPSREGYVLVVTRVVLS